MDTSKHSLNCISTNAWNVHQLVFDLTNIHADDLSPHVKGPHAFQFILNPTGNRALRAENKIQIINMNVEGHGEQVLELFRRPAE